MTTEQLARGLGRRLTRRSFLAKLGTGAVGVVLGLIGVVPETAHATHQPITYFCCTLCVWPESICEGYACAWCWDCTSGQCLFHCCEYYAAGVSCNGSCHTHTANEVKCSTAHGEGIGCPTSPRP
jgi:hypothetical protein